MLRHDGADRARFLLERLVAQAGCVGASPPLGGTTPYPHPWLMPDFWQFPHPHPILSEPVGFAAAAAAGTITDLYLPKRPSRAAAPVS